MNEMDKLIESINTFKEIEDLIKAKKKIVFQTIDGQKYGQIELDYDYLGNLYEFF